MTAIREKCGEAVALVGEWLDLMKSRPDEHSDWLAERAGELRRDLLTAVPLARSAVECDRAARQTSWGLPPAAACQVVLRALDDLSRLLGADGEESERVTPPSHQLHGELLRLPQVELNDRWEPIEPGGEMLLLGVLDLILQGERGWTDVLKGCWDQQNFLAAERVLELVEQAEAPGGGVAGDGLGIPALRTEHDGRRSEARQNLRANQELASREVEKARLKGLIDEDERLDLTNRLNAIDWEHSLLLGRDRAELDAIWADFTRWKQRRIEEFEERITVLGVAESSPAAYARIRRVLKAEDLVTAHEYLAVIERGGELPTTVASAAGFDFFGTPADDSPDFFSRIEPVFFGKDRLQLRDVARRVQDRLPLGLIDLGDRLTPGQALQAREVLEEWSRLKLRPADRSGDTARSVQKILSFIGFGVRSLSDAREASPSGRLFDLEADPIQSRSDCVLPDFASRCQGRYQVLWLEGQPLEEEILRAANTERRAQPLIALFFGSMSSRRRRDLAHALRRRPARRLLVLDDILLVYLGLQKNRLAAFFNAACQFSMAEPYITTSSQIPPEMFFGRASEIKSVFSPEGTNLVYGGRQLGKTALLNEVRRRYHRPEQGVIVELFDLRHGENLGLTRPFDDIWPVIAARLQPWRIVLPASRKGQTIAEEIVKWIDQDNSRRIVLLLDEADDFLNADSKEGWPRVGRLKTMMERAGRRFKVVFAGLHNVQRTSHDVNTPLAHLGTPICVGPFLSDAEMRDAMDMVTLPFRAMGYRFESLDLVGRILAQSNYYPSLIQISCQELLRRLSGPDNPALDPARTPPYPIRLVDIENAYAEPGLRNQIYDRFRWTLELDNRYRVIALCLALETLDDPPAAARGFTLPEIRAWALREWPRGFEDSPSNDSFRTLLDEMCELGVLRSVAGGRYTMRSPNVISLLGTQEHILETLYDATKESPRIEYEAKTFRRVYDQHTKWRRSPLTAAQESLLGAPSANGLFVLFGTEAAGLGEVRPFLEVLATNVEAEALSVAVIADLHDLTTLQGRLDRVMGEREEGLTLVMIDPQCPWSEEWVMKAGGMVARRAGAKRRFVKVLFAGGPREAWLWSDLSEEGRRRLEVLGLVEMSLSPWSDHAVRQWKKEAEFGENTDEDSERFRKATGHRCFFLHEVGRLCIERPHQWKDEVARYRAALASDPSALNRFGLLPEVRPVLQAMAQYGDPLTTGDLCNLIEMEGGRGPVDLIERVLRGADLLSLARPAGENRWALDTFLGRMLSAGSSDAQR